MVDKIVKPNPGKLKNRYTKKNIVKICRLNLPHCVVGMYKELHTALCIRHSVIVFQLRLTSIRIRRNTTLDSAVADLLVFDFVSMEANTR